MLSSIGDYLPIFSSQVEEKRSISKEKSKYLTAFFQDTFPEIHKIDYEAFQNIKKELHIIKQIKMNSPIEPSIEIDQHIQCIQKFNELRNVFTALRDSRMFHKNELPIAMENVKEHLSLFLSTYPEGTEYEQCKKIFHKIQQEILVSTKIFLSDVEEVQYLGSTEEEIATSHDVIPEMIERKQEDSSLCATLSSLPLEEDLSLTTILERSDRDDKVMQKSDFSKIIKPLKKRYLFQTLIHLPDHLPKFIEDGLTTEDKLLIIDYNKQNLFKLDAIPLYSANHHRLPNICHAAAAEAVEVSPSDHLEEFQIPDLSIRPNFDKREDLKKLYETCQQYQWSYILLNGTKIISDFNKYLINYLDNIIVGEPEAILLEDGIKPNIQKQELQQFQTMKWYVVDHRLTKQRADNAKQKFLHEYKSYCDPTADSSSHQPIIDLVEKEGVKGLIRYLHGFHTFYVATVPAEWGFNLRHRWLAGKVGHHAFLVLNQRIAELNIEEPSSLVELESRISQLELRTARGRDIEKMVRGNAELLQASPSLYRLSHINWLWPIYTPFVTDCFDWAQNVLKKGGQVSKINSWRVSFSSTTKTYDFSYNFFKPVDLSILT